MRVTVKYKRKPNYYNLFHSFYIVYDYTHTTACTRTEYSAFTQHATYLHQRLGQVPADIYQYCAGHFSYSSGKCAT